MSIPSDSSPTAEAESVDLDFSPLAMMARQAMQEQPAPRHTPKGDIHLVAVDLDGTLLSSRKSITPRTHTALRAALDQGVRIILASARPPRSVRPYYAALKLQTPQINYNGALLWDEPNHKVLRHRPLASQTARRVIEFARRRYPQIMVSVEILDKWYTDHFEDIPEYTIETAKQFTPDFIGPIEAFLTVPVTKLMFLGKPEWIADLEQAMPGKFAKTAAHTRSDPFLLQVMSIGVSKGQALNHIAKDLGIERSHIMAIGDAPNDLDMLAAAGISVAMENAWEQVRALANYMVPSNDDEGVAVALERFVLAGRS